MNAPEMTQSTTKQPNAHLIGYLAEQPLHPGTGQALGAIDQPVAREGGSKIPVIPGSSHKGSIKHAVTGGNDKDPFWALFGGTDNEGGVLFSDIRLILLPIRSSVGSYKWATCPYLLERLARDLKRTGYGCSFEVPAVPDDKVLTEGKTGGRIYLEELTFTIGGAVDETIRTELAKFIPADDPYGKVAARLEKQLLIMSDDDFAWFARYGLPIYARNVLEKETKKSRNLWYEEHLPADTLMYGIVAARGETDGKYADKENKIEGKSYNDFIERLKGDEQKKIDPLQYLQIGGDETVGRGFCRLHVVKGA
ncbi:CRISPR-associated RAMP protein, Cmr4 family [Candidatus Defluviicoccus seviourii]|uniref:CRISPR-associated RAMP protein, Cmr4 family n=2 Tax=root TaxID=1 RepID=A0A564WFU9_9PROT|nr:CRISPR-associated RAMP protein, Cmr4 family [uncultured Defluviicoccus sp.]VUX46999.1 CRISPR-associated RAMP protein, Cmr4 family [Candidatus Defluviicoccus seviourii]